MLPLVVAQVLRSAVRKLDKSTKVLPVGGTHCRDPSNTCPVKERVLSIWQLVVVISTPRGSTNPSLDSKWHLNHVSSESQGGLQREDGCSRESKGGR